MKMVSICQKRVILLTSGRRDPRLSSDVYLWLHIKAHISLQAPLVTVHKGLLCISEPPCQYPGPHPSTHPPYNLLLLSTIPGFLRRLSFLFSHSCYLCFFSLPSLVMSAFLFLFPGLFQMRLAVFPLMYTIKSCQGVVLLAVSLLMITHAWIASSLPTVLVWFLSFFLFCQLNRSKDNVGSENFSWENAY